MAKNSKKKSDKKTGNKIVVFNTKGSAGKTPISANIALDKNYCIGTNEMFHIYQNFMSDDQLLSVEMEEGFPDVGDIDIVFDLAGSISRHAASIESALTCSDVVIVPIYNELKCLVAGLNTINVVSDYNKNIIVIATKLQKTKKDMFSDDWRESIDFKNISTSVNAKFPKIKVLPLKFSKVFDNIFEQEKSIRQIMETNPLSAFSYREVAGQFDDIYKALGI